MALIAVFSLFSYMGSLAIALTWYGADLMNLRWLALFALLIAGGFYWGSSRWGKLYRWEKNDNMIVLAYLILTFLSVITAENPLFSGLRWVSHGLMIVTLLVLLKNSLTLDQAAGILMFLKAVISALLLVSWLKPLSPAILMDTFQAYRGAFGSSNALGQVAAVGAVLYLHGFLTDKAKWMRGGQVVMLCLALWTVWSSGSRSALVAFLTALALMYYFYPKLIRGKLFWVALLVTCMILMFPWVPGKVSQIVLRSDEPWQSFSEQLSLAQKQDFAEHLVYARKQDLMEQLLITRKGVWEAAWTGFQKRPLLGWGFGATEGIPKEWKVELKALGTINRDAVNDTLFVLEGSGVVGLCAYVLLVVFALRQIPTRRERHVLGRIHSPPSHLRGSNLASCHLHAVTFILAASLLLMVQFDNTALSAGNFVSVMVWLCVTLAGTVRVKAIAHEFLLQQHRHTLPRPPASELATMCKVRTGTRESHCHSLQGDSLDRWFWFPLGTWPGRVVANDRS